MSRNAVGVYSGNDSLGQIVRRQRTILERGLPGFIKYRQFTANLPLIYRQKKENSESLSRYSNCQSPLTIDFSIYVRLCKDSKSFVLEVPLLMDYMDGGRCAQKKKK